MTKQSSTNDAGKHNDLQPGFRHILLVAALHRSVYLRATFRLIESPADLSNGIDC